jgi:transmembrane sensor
MEPTKKASGVDTEQAWVKLKARLEQDGLLPESKQLHSRQVISIQAPWVKWAATLLLLVAAGSIVFLGIGKRQQGNFFALSNDSEQLTLVKTLEDGSIVYLAENAVLNYPPVFGTTERKVKLNGKAFFDVVHDPSQPFKVEAGNSVIEVLGTAFSVNTISSNQVEVFVEEGLVRVSTGKSYEKSVTVASGEVLQLESGNFQKSEANDLLLAMWRQDRMHFKDEELSTILNVINRNYNANLILGEAPLGERQLTVTFFNNSLPTIIELLCLSLNLEARMQPDSSVILQSR